MNGKYNLWFKRKKDQSESLFRVYIEDPTSLLYNRFKYYNMFTNARISSLQYASNCAR